METTINIKAQLEAFLAENEKFEKGNSAAGTRARKALGELAKLSITDSEIKSSVKALENPCEGTAVQISLNI